MEVDEIQTPQQACKYSRVNSNGKIDSSKIATRGGEEGSGGGDGTNACRVVVPTTAAAAAANAVTGNGSGVGVGVGGDMVVGSSNRFGRQWQHSSRIIRVSRASGGKDRHSKVWTAKGPRDRRVRLSVTTAIQFYDLQDRLGYDQPSKAVEWLIKAAADAINELPSLDTASFPPETPRQLTDERRVATNVVDSTEMELDGEPHFGQTEQQQQQQQQMGSKSGCSSNNSETSKGSELSLSQKEFRNKARERDGETNLVGSHHLHPHQHNNKSSMPQTSSFTQLLTAGMSNLNESNNGGGSGEVGLFHKHSRGGGGGGGGGGISNNNRWLSTTSSTTSMADYFGTGFMGLSSSRAGQIQLGNNPSSLPQMITLTSFGGSENHHNHHGHDQLEHHHPQQQFPFVSDHHHHHHLIQVANAESGASGGGNEYNLNFTMSSSSTATPSLTAGFNNRGTLQSNSPSLLPYLQRFSADGSGLPFFLGNATAVSSASPTIENHHHHFQPPGLQLCYADNNGPRQTDHKGKGKN